MDAPEVCQRLNASTSGALADELGRWRGSGFGDLVDQRFLIQQGIQFPLKGRYFLEVTHGMRTDPMADISDVGMRLERP